MEKIRNLERLDEIRIRIMGVSKDPDGIVDVSFVRNIDGEEAKGEFSISPETFKEIGFRGNLEPGMDIILWLDETNKIRSLKRIVH
jgi:hypothetical protein